MYRQYDSGMARLLGEMERVAVPSPDLHDVDLGVERSSRMWWHRRKTLCA